MHDHVGDCNAKKSIYNSAQESDEVQNEHSFFLNEKSHSLFANQEELLQFGDTERLEREHKRLHFITLFISIFTVITILLLVYNL